MSGLLASELLKLRSTRVAWVFAGVVLLIGALAGAATGGTGELGGDDPVGSLARAGSLSTVFATLLGILVLTNEYRHGTITHTLLATPRRATVLAAKLLVGTATGAVFGVFAIVALLAVALPWAATRDEAVPFDGDLVAGLARVVLAFALSGLLGVAIGAVIRNQVGAIAATFAYFFVVEPILAVVGALIDGDFEEGNAIAPYLLGSALDAVALGDQDALGSEFLSFAGGVFAVLAYAAVLVAVGAWSMLHRDA